MAGTELATAYLSLVPSFKGGKAAIAKELSGAEGVAAASGAKAGKQFTGGMKSGLVGLAAVGAAGTGIVKLGGDFQSAYKTIRVGTGETGKDLQGLKGDFKALLAVRPDSMKDVAAAITSVHQATGATGKPLQDLAKTYLQLSGITGTDLATNLKQTRPLFVSFGVAAKNQAGSLDQLYRAAQKSGGSVSEIASAMTAAGPSARTLGLDFQKTAAYVATFEKSGLGAGAATQSMTKFISGATMRRTSLIKKQSAAEKVLAEAQMAVQNATRPTPAMLEKVAKAQKKLSVISDSLKIAQQPLPKQFADTLKRIKEAPDAMSAAGIATEAFGAKSGPKLSEMLRSGKLSYDDLLKSISGGKDTIGGAAKDTGTMAGKLKTLKNSFLVAIEPLASGAFDAANQALKDWLPIITKIVQRGASMPGWVKKTVVAVALLVPAVKVFKKLHSGVTTVVGGFKSMYRASVSAKNGAVKAASALKSGAQSLAGYAKSGASAAVSIAKTTGAWVAQKAALIASKVATLAMSAAQKAATAAQWAFNTAMSANPVMLAVLAIGALVAGVVLAYKKVGWFRAAVDAAFGGIKTVVGVVVGFIRKHWQALLAVITGPIGIAVLLITKHWDTIKGGVARVIGFVRDHWKGLLAIITGPVGLAVLTVTKHWNTIKSGFGTVRDVIRGRVSDIAGFITGLPGRLKSVAKKLKDALLAPFKAAFRAVANLWNNSLGKLSFKVPSWIPKMGGKGWKMPNINVDAFDKYHSGGRLRRIPGRTGQEVPFIGLAGERVLSVRQTRMWEAGQRRGGPALDGGPGGWVFQGPVTFGENSRRTVRDLELWSRGKAPGVMAG